RHTRFSRDWSSDVCSSDLPRLLGQVGAVLPRGHQKDSVLRPDSWLEPDDADRLARLIEQLRVHGSAFAASLHTLDGRLIRANGWVLGGGTAMRLRPAFIEQQGAPALAAAASDDLEITRAILAALPQPAFARDAADRLCYANGPYLELARAQGKTGSPAAPPELLDETHLQAHLAACAS